MAKEYDVISVGSGVVDAFVYTGVREHDDMISFPAGTKILVEKIEFSIGGGGINTSACVSHLGLKTGFLGKIGKGYNAEMILDELKKYSVDFLGINSGEHSGYSIILESDKKHRTILTFKGASDNLKFNEVKFNRLKTKWFYFTSMKDESFKTQNRLVGLARKNGIKIAFNPSSYQTKEGAGRIANILRNTDFLSLNKEEAGMLVKGGDYKVLYNLGPKIICITDGEKEGKVYDGRTLYRYFPKEVLVSECTGAGDTFGSSFVAGLIRFNDIENSIKMAMANAESVIKGRGTNKNLLTWKEAERIIKSGRFNIKKEEH